MATFLRPTALKLRNFKGIAELDLTLDESMTLLAGVNGVGKTSVIQALLAAVTDLWQRITFFGDAYPTYSFREEVVRVGTVKSEIELNLAGPDKSPLEVRWTLDGSGLHLVGTWIRRQQLVFEKFAQSLPLVVYYEQDRVSTRSSGQFHVSVSSKGNRESSLKTTVYAPSEFQAWFFEKEADEGQEIRERRNLHYSDPELDVVRKLLEQLDGFTNVRSRKLAGSSERTLFLEKDGANIPFDSLSGGEKSFFLLAADLARRLMLESPDTPIDEAPGIVCIDEIELHLHPAWQKKILRTLMDTFPACQFVVTTHSPQVIGGVEAHHVRLLEPAENGVRIVSQPIATKGRDSNYVLEGVLDTPERDDEVSKLFDEFDRLIDARELEDAGQVLDKLDNAVEGGSSRVAVRRAKWNRLRRTEV